MSTQKLQAIDTAVWPRHKMLSRNKAVAALYEAGFDPIAALPRKVWDRFCRDLGLYRFEQLDARQMTYGNTDRLIPSMLILLFRLFLTLVVTIGGTLGALSFFGLKGIPIALTTPIVAEMIFSRYAVSFGAHTVSLTMRYLPTWFLMWRLWPAKTDHGDVSYSRGLVQVYFPGMPDSFCNAFKAVYDQDRFHPCIAAAPSAIVLDRSGLGDHAAELWRLQACPILYVVVEETVVILDQYGELPSEQTLLNWAKAYKE